MIKLIKNKKATEGELYLSIWLFLILGITSISIAVAISYFSSVFIDVRQAEADLISITFLDCLSNDFNYNGLFNNDLSLYSKCGLNKNFLESFGYYYINVTIVPSDSSSIVYSNTFGDKTYEALCSLEKSRIKNGEELDENFPRCSYGQIKVFDNNLNKEYAVYVLAASNHL